MTKPVARKPAAKLQAKPKAAPKPPADPLAVLDAPRNKGGRPKALAADAATTRLMGGLGRIQATDAECAAALGVSLPTFKKFRDDNPAVGDAQEAGKGLGCVSLRRKQIDVALAGNPTMLIWLGKQLLGQRDKQDIEHSGELEMKGSGVSALLAAAKRGANASEPD